MGREKEFTNYYIECTKLGTTYYQILEDWSMIILGEEEINRLQENLVKLRLTCEGHSIVNDSGRQVPLLMINFGPTFKITIKDYSIFFDEKGRNEFAENLFWKISNFVSEDEYHYTDPREFHLKLAEWIATRKENKRISLGREPRHPGPLYVDLKKLDVVQKSKILDAYNEQLNAQGHIVDLSQNFVASEDFDEPSMGGRQ